MCTFENSCNQEVVIQFRITIQEKDTMIPPYLSKLSAEHEEYASTYARMFRGSHSLPITLQELEQQVAELFRLLSGSSASRATCYAVVTQIFSSDRSIENQLYSQLLVKSIASILDRLTGLMESVATEEEAHYMITMLDSLFSLGSSELTTLLSKIVPKLVQSACRLCNNKPELSEYSLSVLLLLLNTELRNLVSPNISSIRQISIRCLKRPDLYPSAPKVLALTHAIDNCDSWSDHFVLYSESCIKLLQNLGILVRHDVTAAKCASIIAILCEQAKGHSKTVCYERCFRGLTETIQNMLIEGCSAGAIKLDTTPFLALVSSVLSLSLKVSGSDPKSVVENQFGVSMVEISLIVSQLKINVLNILTTLLEQRGSSLVRICSPICRPLAALISSNDFKELPELSTGALKCMSLVIRAFPTVVSKNLNFGISNLVDMFAQEISVLTISRNDVATEEFSKQFQRFGHGTYSRSTSAGPISIFEVMESILLFCGPLLPQQTREMVEMTIAQGLDSICKGIFPPQYSDRKVKRSTCEGMRQFPEAQRLLLSVALIEVLSSSKNGLMSGNVALLKRAAVCCLSQNETSVEASRVLLTIDMILHPSAMTLPTMPALAIGKSFIENCSVTNKATTSIFDVSMNKDKIQPSEKISVQESNTTVESTSVIAISKDSHSHSTTGNKKRALVESSNSSLGVTTKRLEAREIEVLPPSMKNISYSSLQSKVKTSGNDGDASDEDSLPDIDVEADPDNA